MSDLKIENFLAYRQAQLVFEPTGLVLVVGPNNAGKSALLSALDVVADTARGGSWRRAGSADVARVTATFRVEDDGERAMILGPGAHAAWIQQLNAVQLVWEDCTAAEMLLSGIWVSSHSGVTGLVVDVEYAAGQTVRTVAHEDAFAVQPEDADWSLVTSSSGGPSTGATIAVASSVLPGLRDRLEAWRQWYFHFAPIRAGSPARSVLGNAVAKLDPTGTNLAQALLYQQTRTSTAWADINRILNDIIPEAGSVQARADQDEIELVLEDPSTHVPLNLKRLGTGVEQVLMAAYVGATQPVRSVVLMEEPEAGLHPAAQRKLLAHLLEWARTRMLLVSTHSTVFLDHSDAHLTRTYLVRRTDGVASLTASVGSNAEVLRVLGVRLSDVASAERVLLVEGDSDVDILRAWFGHELDEHQVAVVPMGGGDKAWHTEAVLQVVDQADTLDRRIMFLRDRDELDDASLRKLNRTGNVHVLARRELENYLLDTDAIASSIDEATPSGVARELDSAIDATRGTVHLKMTVGRLPPIRTPGRDHVKRLCKAGAGLEQLLLVVSEVASPEELADRVRSEWNDISTLLDREWAGRRAELAPGEEILDAIWRAHGGRYDKRRDGPQIAAHMSQRPAELEDVIDRLVSDEFGR